MNRVSVINLFSASLNREQEFSIEHAERLLSIKDCGWQIKDNDKYEYIKGYGIRVRTNKKSSSKSE